MSLTNVWVQTWADGLVRADQIVGIDAHPTPAVAGKPSRWLVDAVLGSPIGSGTAEQWGVTVLHRTLIQLGQEPREAPLALARLLAQLDLVSAAGVISVHVDAAPAQTARAARTGDTATVVPETPDHLDEQGRVTAGAGQVRFRFTAFADPEPGRHTDLEYL